MAASESTITLTTETWQRRAGYLFVLLILAGEAVFFVTMVALEGRESEGRDAMIPLVFLVLIVLGVLAVSAGMVMRTRGTWHIKDEGIESIPRYGEPQYLAWKDVERVHWDFPKVFEGKGRKVRIGMGFIDGRERNRAIRRIREILEPDFDLPPERVPRPVRMREFLAGIRRVLLALAAPVAIILVLLHYRDEEWAGRLFFLLFLIGTGSLLVVGACIARREHRRRWISRRQRVKPEIRGK